MEYVLALINAIFAFSLLWTWKYYPPQPIYDLETDVVIGEYYGVTWHHFGWFAVFTMISRWGYMQINNSNSLGIMPGYALDLFGLNLLT